MWRRREPFTTKKKEPDWDEIIKTKSWEKLSMKEKMLYFVKSGVWIQTMSITGADFAELVEMVAKKGTPAMKRRVIEMLKRA